MELDCSDDQKRSIYSSNNATIAITDVKLISCCRLAKKDKCFLNISWREDSLNTFVDRRKLLTIHRHFELENIESEY